MVCSTIQCDRHTEIGPDVDICTRTFVVSTALRPSKRPSLLQERAEVQRLQQAVTARDLAAAAAEGAVADERRAAALQGARLAATQAALQQREAEFQALRTSARWHRPLCVSC